MRLRKYISKISLIGVLALLGVFAPCEAHAAVASHGFCSAATTNCIVSAISTNDLFICAALRSGSTTAPSNPAGMTSLLTKSSAAGTTEAIRISYRFASSAADTGSGTFTNAGDVACRSYTGAGKPGASASGTANTSTTIVYPALTLQHTGSTSWVLGFASDSAAAPGAPTGMTSVTTVGTGPGIRLSDTNAAVSSWTAQNVTVASGTWIAADVEIPALFQFTSCATGNWASGSTWEPTGSATCGGSMTPGDGSNVTLGDGFTVTVASGTTAIAGASPANDTSTPAIQPASSTGTGVLIVNGTLIYRGTVQQAAAWTFGAGSHVQHDSSLATSPSATHYSWQFNFAAGLTPTLTINGTSGSHVTWDIAGSSGKAGTVGATFGTGDGGGITATYLDAASIGNNSSASFNVPLHSSGATFSIDHITCASCGEVSIGEVADGSILSITNSVVSTVSDASNNFRALGLGEGADIPTKTTGTRTIQNNYFENGDIFTSCAALTTQPHILFSGNVIFNSGTSQNTVALLGQGGSGVCNYTGTEFQNNLFWSQDNSVTGNGSIWPGGTTSRSYYLFGSSVPCSSSGDNYHFINVPTVNDVLDTLIAENDCSSSTGGGKIILTQGGVGSAAFSVEVKNSITLPSTNASGSPQMAMLFDDAGGACNGTTTFCPDLNIHNNTIIASNQGDVCGLYGRENTAFTGVQSVSAAKDNIGWVTASGALCKLGSTITPETGSLQSVNFNWWFNDSGTGREYSNSPGSYSTPSPPGTNDHTGDPQFVDSTRNFLNWCKTLNGADASWSDCFVHFKAQTSGYNVTDLIDWVRAGFAPQNATLATASSTGSYIGAVPPPTGSARPHSGPLLLGSGSP